MMLTKIKAAFARKLLMVVDPWRDAVATWAMRLLARNVSEDEFLDVMRARLQRYGLDLSVKTITPPPAPEPDPLFLQVPNELQN